MDGNLALKKFTKAFLLVASLLFHSHLLYAGFSDAQMASERIGYMKKVCANGVQPKFFFAAPVEDDPAQPGKACVRYTWKCTEGNKVEGVQATGGSDLEQASVECKTPSEVFRDNDNNAGGNSQGGGCQGGSQGGNGQGDGNCGGGNGHWNGDDIYISGMCFGSCIGGPCEKQCGKYLRKGKGWLGGKRRRCLKCLKRYAEVGCMYRMMGQGSSSTCSQRGRTMHCSNCDTDLGCAYGAGGGCDPSMGGGIYTDGGLTKKQRRKLRRWERKHGDTGEEYCEDCERSDSRRRRGSGKFWDFLGKVVEVGAPVAGQVLMTKYSLDSCNKLYNTYSGYKADAGETIPSPQCGGNALTNYPGFYNTGAYVGGNFGPGYMPSYGSQGYYWNNNNMGGTWPNAAYNAPSLAMWQNVNGVGNASFYNPGVYANANGFNGYYYNNGNGPQYGISYGNNPNYYYQNYNAMGYYGANAYYGGGPTAQDIAIWRARQGTTAGNYNGNYYNYSPYFNNGYGQPNSPTNNGSSPSGCVVGINC